MPTAYALNRALPESATQPFIMASTYAARALDAQPSARGPGDPRRVVADYLRTRQADADLSPALARPIVDIKDQVEQHGSIRRLPADAVQNIRNDMYLAGEAVARLIQDPNAKLAKADAGVLKVYRSEVNGATRYIPTWVKIAVAIALGLGTMVGWRRIVITVGEKIGKSHLTYAQGASAEVVAATTIAAADLYGLPVSTTQVLSSGVCGTMAANGSGVQASTIRNLAIAWVLTMPIAILLSGGLFMLFRVIL